MNKTELRLLSYAYENYQKTLDPHCIYRWHNGNDMFFVSEALESLTEKGYISDVPSDIIFRSGISLGIFTANAIRSFIYSPHPASSMS